MQFELGDVLFMRLQQLSPAFHARTQTGDLVRRVTMDSRCVEEFLLGICLPAATAVVMLLAMFAVILSMSVWIAFLAVFMALPIGVLVRRLIPKITEQSLIQQNIEGEVMSLAETNLSALPILHAFDRTEMEGQRFRSLTDRSVAALARATMSEQLFGILAGTTVALGTAVVLGVGGFQVLNGSLQVGSLLVILSYLALLYAPVETLARLSSAFAHSAAKAKRAYAILTEQGVVAHKQDAVAASVPERAAGAIAFEDVSFGYTSERSTIRRISLTVAPGETIAIVGPTGAGKSTLIALLLRLFDPNSGRVTLDGVDLRAWPLDNLRRQFGLVLQDPYLLPVSVRDNIAFGAPEAELQRVVAAAQTAGADGFIRRLPENYATILGERGVSLSARALVREAPVMIFDEPTAALDLETERKLMAAFYPRTRERTTIIIAHRLSTVRDADKIVVLNAGEIAEIGTHIELMGRGGLYSQLVQQSTMSHCPCHEREKSSASNAKT
jgi:ATP-binding cassette subfamily B protein/subfamily B ATP-binding cassette protein MsbA